MNYDSKSEICALLKERGLSPTKKFGQNFMISPSAREKVLSFVNIKEGSYVWEIGGGLGSMTSMALKRVGDTGRLVVFEIDRGYISFLGEQFGANPGFEIAEGDMVKTWKGIFEKYGGCTKASINVTASETTLTAKPKIPLFTTYHLRKFEQCL